MQCSGMQTHSQKLGSGSIRCEITTEITTVNHYTRDKASDTERKCAVLLTQ